MMKGLIFCLACLIVSTFLAQPASAQCIGNSCQMAPSKHVVLRVPATAEVVEDKTVLKTTESTSATNIAKASTTIAKTAETTTAETKDRLRTLIGNLFHRIRLRRRAG
jgi:hypothetical protein